GYFAVNSQLHNYTTTQLPTPKRSFRAQRDEGIDARDLAGGRESGQGREQDERQRGAAQHDRVGGRDAVEQAAVLAAHQVQRVAEQTGNDHRDGEPDRGADDAEARRLPERGAHHRVRLLTEREADAEFARPLLDRAGHGAVDADRRQNDRDRREPADQQRAEPITP